MGEATIHLRPMEAGDVNFVLSSWLRSYRDASPDVQESRIPGAVYWPMHEAVVRDCMKRGQVAVAYQPDAPEVILGWACLEETANHSRALHYLYVKHLYRAFHVEDFLSTWLPECRWYTHRTPRLQAVAERLSLTFNPYLAGVAP